MKGRFKMGTRNSSHASKTLPELICQLRVKPKQHPSMLLGTFSADKPPLGFSITLSPNPNPDDSFTTRIATSGTDDSYKLILHVDNHGTKPVNVKVHPIR